MLIDEAKKCILKTKLFEKVLWKRSNEIVSFSHVLNKVLMKSIFSFGDADIVCRFLSHDPK